jgi:hypothetical protein
VAVGATTIPSTMQAVKGTGPCARPNFTNCLSAQTVPVSEISQRLAQLKCTIHDLELERRFMGCCLDAHVRSVRFVCELLAWIATGVLLRSALLQRMEAALRGHAGLAMDGSCCVPLINNVQRTVVQHCMLTHVHTTHTRARVRAWPFFCPHALARQPAAAGHFTSTPPLRAPCVRRRLIPWLVKRL